MSHIPARLRRIAGVLALAHVLLIFVGIGLQEGPLFSDGVGGITDGYVQGDLTRTFTGGLVEAIGFILFVPVLVMLSRVWGRRTEAGRWAAQSGLMCGMAYVAVVFAVGFPAGAAAMYGAQHGLDVDAAFAVNNIRLFAHFLSMFLLGGATLGVALAALADRSHMKWVGYLGVVTAAALLVSPPLAAVAWQDLGTLVWLGWIIGVAVVLLRCGDTEADSFGSTTEPALVGQA